MLREGRRRLPVCFDCSIKERSSRRNSPFEISQILGDSFLSIRVEKGELDSESIALLILFKASRLAVADDPAHPNLTFG